MKSQIAFCFFFLAFYYHEGKKAYHILSERLKISSPNDLFFSFAESQPDCEHHLNTS